MPVNVNYSAKCFMSEKTLLRVQYLKHTFLTHHTVTLLGFLLILIVVSISSIVTFKILLCLPLTQCVHMGSTEQN